MLGLVYPPLQLELNLWQQIAQAQQSSQSVDWQQLCLAFDEAIAQTPTGQKLATAADAIAEMADVFAARADEFFSTWHRQRVAHKGPSLDNDLFSEFVRQSFHLNLDGLVGVPELYIRSGSEKSHDAAESVVVAVTKETALLLAGTADEVEPEDEVMELQAYDEDVAAWANAIALWMQQRGCDQVGFAGLLDGVGYPVVKGWLAVLLDEGFAIDRLEGSDFYRSAGIFVALKQEVIAESLCEAIAC